MLNQLDELVNTCFLDLEVHNKDVVVGRHLCGLIYIF
jgi:hypothetical protein